MNIFTPKNNDELREAVKLWCINPSDPDYDINFWLDVFIEYGHISTWNTKNITDMSKLFQNCEFNEDISNWNVSNVTDMSCMFMNTENFS